MDNKADYQYKLLIHHFGNVPSGWNVAQLGDIFTERVEPNADLEKYPLYSFTIENGVTPKTERYERSFLLKDEEGNEYKLVHPNDFVINPMNLRFGAIGYSKVKKIVSVSAYYDILEVQSTSIDIDFLEGFLSSKAMFNIYNRVSTGSLIEKQRVHCSEFKGLRIFFPPECEQKRMGDIIRCWNKAIRNIENLIATKLKRRCDVRKQLLTGKKRFKEFADQEWQEKSLIQLTYPNGLLSDGDWVESKDQDPLGDVRLVQLADVGDGTFLNKSSRYLSSSKAQQLRCTILEAGDVLIARMPDPLGRACVYPLEEMRAVTVVDVAIVRPNNDVCNEWLVAAINFEEFRKKINDRASGTTRTRVPTSSLSTMRLKVPSTHEQRRIANVLNACDKEIEVLKKQLDALKRQKRGLMQKLLTGQIRIKVDEQTQQEAVSV